MYLLYIRSISNNQITSRLLCAKSRVAPLKATSIPRLELCSATLLVELMSKIRTVSDIRPNRIVYWSDCTITLSWIKAESRNYKTFVANRIGKIQTNSDPSEWRHVKTYDNPADMISRGIKADQLVYNTLWWHRPSWLLHSESAWPSLEVQVSNNELPEKRNTTTKLGISLKNFLPSED